MSKVNYTELTNATYKVIDSFPEEDVLQNRAKEKALAIMDNLVLISLPEWSFQKGKAALEILRDIEILMGYLNLANAKGWVEDMNLGIIANEYEKVKQELKPITDLIQKNPFLVENQERSVDNRPVDNIVKKGLGKAKIDGQISPRQEKIIEILKNQEKVQVSDLKNVLPEVSKRTLRRDIDDLLKKGKIERIGEFNQIFYKINNQVLPVEKNENQAQNTAIEA